MAKTFDVNRDGFIDYYEFISALHPSRDILHRAANVDHIQEEVGEPGYPPPYTHLCSLTPELQLQSLPGSVPGRHLGASYERGT